uniref:NADH-ubiquinone oxidoreductase chain 2 n=1 Tax=Tetrastemma olgarum TaxID=1526548 RepID=A0A0U1V281_9BILA|nr:NADH dehydrogenase subunit 2 [Tetrastemma olgarum]AIH00396.1 NADH dehydrogenase subunit 2 [Tetrastemma olgarum]
MVFPFFFVMGFLVVMGSLFSVSSVSWFGVWGGMEVNMLCFIPMVMYFSNFMGVESVVKYFLIQSFGSVGVLLGGLFEDSCFLDVFSLFFILCFSLLLKVGVFPFHWWLPGVMGGLSWVGVLLLSTWQKVAPVFVFSGVSSMSMVLLIFCAFSSVVGGVGGMGQTSVRSVLAYSSIGHAGWFFSIFCMSWVFGFIYFFVYFVSTLFLIGLFWYFDYFWFTQNFVSSFWGCVVMFVSVLTVAGVPPFFGFFTKVFVFMIFGSSFLGFIFLFVLIVGSLISLYFYMGLFFSVFFFFFCCLKNFSSKLLFYGVLFFAFFSLFGVLIFDYYFFFFYDILV